MSADTIESRIRAWAQSRRLPEVHLERWLALAGRNRSVLLEMAEALRLRTGQFIAALDLLEEIALRDRQSIANVLARSDIRGILEGTGSAPGRARVVLGRLRAIRFPQLARTTDRLRVEVAALALPHGVNVVLPQDLSSDELRIEISAHSGAELEKLIGAIEKNTTALKRIARMLGGADEV
jgi:hypothetical protein